MQLSVIIPTHNRSAILKQCLTRLLAQKGVEFEVIVVADGCTDDTAEVMKDFTTVQFIEQPKSQQGVARNRGVKVAKGEVILFIGDDIFVEPGFLRAHWQAHQAHESEEVMVLGFSTWDPALEINDLMRFLEKSGWQFGYGFLKPGFVEREDRYKFCYTSNISLKKSLFEKERFDEQFKAYGWEDIEWAYRLKKNHGMRLFYEPKAKAFHYDSMDLERLPQKMQTIGKSALVFEKLHPEVRLVPRGAKKWLIWVATLPTFVFMSRLLGKNIHYKLFCWQQFLKGLTK